MMIWRSKNGELHGRRTWVDKAVLKTPKEHLKASVDKASVHI